ncbi:MAG: hypothetical protein WC956_04925 [bacterium]
MRIGPDDRSSLCEFSRDQATEVKSLEVKSLMEVIENAVKKPDWKTPNSSSSAEVLESEFSRFFDSEAKRILKDIENGIKRPDWVNR